MTAVGIARLPTRVKSILEAVSEAANSPANLGAPSTAETPWDLHERLLVTRAAMTRVADLCADLTLLTSRVKITLIEARGELEDEEAALVSRRRPVLTEDYSSAREKNARLAAGTLETRQKVRQAEKVLAEAEAAQAYARERHRELDRAVRDIDTRLRLLSYEPSAS